MQNTSSFLVQLWLASVLLQGPHSVVPHLLTPGLLEAWLSRVCAEAPSGALAVPPPLLLPWKDVASDLLSPVLYDLGC